MFDTDFNKDIAEAYPSYFINKKKTLYDLVQKINTFKDSFFFFLARLAERWKEYKGSVENRRTVLNHSEKT